jgi:hypothetical protein
LNCHGESDRAQGRPKFPDEREAKKFAKAKLVDTPNVTAGTLNPHLPKRTIAAKYNGSNKRSSRSRRMRRSDGPHWGKRKLARDR